MSDKKASITIAKRAVDKDLDHLLAYPPGVMNVAGPILRATSCLVAVLLMVYYWCRAFASRQDVTPAMGPTVVACPTPSALKASLPTTPRILPRRFPPNTHLPPVREALVVGYGDSTDFDPARDLILVEDSRVWWESDENQEGDDENDHLMHYACEKPFRSAVEMVAARGGQLKVYDAYRPTGVHSPRSLHREGRALDLTCEGLSLEELAKICWVAGFDWVYYEAKSKGGSHVHCSVRKPDENPLAVALGATETQNHPSSSRK